MLSASRTTEESIILMISGAISLFLLPFVVLRFLQGEIPVALLNSAAVSITGGLFFHVLLARQTSMARWGLSLLSVIVMTTTIALKGHAQIVWAYPALTTVFFLLSPRIAALICIAFLANVVLMIWPAVDSVFVLKFVISAGATLLFCYAFASTMRNQQVFLEQMATSDPLTQVGNRRALEEKLLKTIERLRRYPEQTSSMIIMDLDHFKAINDNYGHATGDEVLKCFTQVIQARIRRTDYLYRFGGEEFVVVLENTGLEEASRLAETLRIAISEAKWPNPDMRITMSAGAAQYNGRETAYEWLARADTAMYDAKAQGRDRCLQA